MHRIAPLFVVALGLQACCPCEDEEPREEHVFVVAGPPPEDMAVQDWYAQYPTWAVIDGRVSEPRNRHLTTLHEEAPDGPITDPVDRLFVCRVSVDKEIDWDVFGSPDPACDLGIGDDPLVRQAVDRLDSSLVHLGWPGATLRAGEPIRLHVTDIDMGRPDLIGDAQAPWTGRAHTVLTHEHFDADCRVIPREAVDARMDLDVAAAGEELAGFEKRLLPDPEDPAWGYPTAQADAARIAVMEVAGLVGWREARAASLRTRYDGAQSRWRELVGASIDAEVATLAPVGTPVPLSAEYELRVIDAVCNRARLQELTGLNDRRRACVLHVQLYNKTAAPLQWRLDEPPSLEGVSLVSPTGQVLSLSPVYVVMPDGSRLAAAPHVQFSADSVVEIPAGAAVEVGLWNIDGEMPLDESKVLRTPTHRMRVR